MKNRFLPFTTTLYILFLSCSISNNREQSKDVNKNTKLTPFEVKLVNSDYSTRHSLLFILTEKELKVISKDDEVGKSDSLVLNKRLQQSDTLQQISNINIRGLQDYYYNECIKDGLQITLTIKKDNTQKSIHVSNYYQEDIGKIIYLINSIVPSKYKIWYNKEKLLGDNKRCKD